MTDNSCSFWTYIYFKRDSYIARQLSSPHFRRFGRKDWKGRQKFGCGCPPSIARSQKTGGGILGDKRRSVTSKCRHREQKKKSSPFGLLFSNNSLKWQEKCEDMNWTTGKRRAMADWTNPRGCRGKLSSAHLALFCFSYCFWDVLFCFWYIGKGSPNRMSIYRL